MAANNRSFKDIVIDELNLTDDPKSSRLDGKKQRMGIDKLRYNFDQGARANLFNVNFFCKQLFLDVGAFEGIRCINASLPGRQVETADWSEYGPTRKMPFNIGTDGQEVSFTFLCDSTFADRFVIEAWQSMVYSGRDGNTIGTAINPQFSYYNDYIGQVEIEQFTKSGEPSLFYKLYEAYPIAFAQQELSAESGDIMKFECTFAYRTFTTEYKKPNPNDGINKGRRYLDLLLNNSGKISANDTLQKFQDRLSRLDGIFGKLGS
tara:strand:- start:972 stop:1760 length:789 start_codon:yes stop_codon:yes gene_type:complete